MSNVNYVAPSHYLRDVMDWSKRKDIINVTVRRLRYYKNKKLFDTVVLRGLSGLMIGPEVCSRLNVPMIVVRKSDMTHGNRNLEVSKYTEDGFRYLILDDFICTGTTVKEIVSAVNKSFPNAKVSAFYSWMNNKFHHGNDLTLWPLRDPFYQNFVYIKNSKKI